MQGQVRLDPCIGDVDLFQLFIGSGLEARSFGKLIRMPASYLGFIGPFDAIVVSF